MEGEPKLEKEIGDTTLLEGCSRFSNLTNLIHREFTKNANEGLETPATTYPQEFFSHSNNHIDNVAAHCGLSTPAITDKLQKHSSIVRRRRRTITTARNLAGPPQRVKKIQEPVQEEEEPNEFDAEPSRWKFSESKEHGLLLKADKLYAHQEPIRSVNEIKSDYNLLKRSSKVGYQEIQSDRNETVKSHLSPKVTESPPPKTSDTIITEKIQNVKEYKDNIMLNGQLYKRHAVLGRGGSSKVYQVTNSNGQVYAIKKVTFDKVDDSILSGYINEVALLKRLSGRDGIIKLYDAEINEERGYLLMLLECGEQDLAHYLYSQNGKPIDLNIIRYYWEQMLKAVYAIQLEKIVHTDLKPANFIIINGTLKLIDFGIAKTIPNDTTNIHRDQHVGTINYMSPEALNDTSDPETNKSGKKCLKQGRPSDVWSLGCILYQMVYGHTPFSHLNMSRKYKAILDENYIISFPATTNNQNDSMVDENLIRIMKGCLERNSKSRLTIPQLLTDPFLKHSQEPLALPILDNLLHEVLKYADSNVVKHNEHTKITSIAKAIFTQLKNREPINSDTWEL
ncbi:kinase-like domain-containing protein [Glomus cerebriforme]|uniref:Kinase-like domain-containing protein n=1 Tax=Glomus cerebriforme TaxID=658196 RepID=A0A397TKS4_9GLOM|nr:kinase-like domain-containing protein [Glomus cerebriforme]